MRHCVATICNRLRNEVGNGAAKVEVSARMACDRAPLQTSDSRSSRLPKYAVRDRAPLQLPLLARLKTCTLLLLTALQKEARSRSPTSEVFCHEKMRSQQQNLSGILAVAALLVSFAAGQPGRFPCGRTSPNQQVCDLLSHPTARRGVLVPIDSECVSAGASGFACGWSGARYVDFLNLHISDMVTCSGGLETLSERLKKAARPCQGVKQSCPTRTTEAFCAHPPLSPDDRCTSDLQCDFGSCDGSTDTPGVCV